MLLKFANITELESNENPYRYFDSNYTEIMSIFSQYSSSQDILELEDEDSAILTMFYLLRGTNKDVIDVKFDLTENDAQLLIDTINTSKFLSTIYECIIISNILHKMTKKNLLSASIDEDGTRKFQITDLGIMACKASYK